MTTAVDVGKKIRSIELASKDKETGIINYRAFYERIMLMKQKIMAGKNP